MDTIEAILDFWYRNFNQNPTAYLAYILATAYWETFPDMSPNRERGGDKYLTDMYDIRGRRPNMAKANGNTEPGDGVRYAGKGLAHVTWRNNYRMVDKRFGFRTEETPELMLQMEVAVPVLVTGMMEGMFTGVQLSEVIQTETESLEQFLDNRAIINGKDKALEIAKIAVKFQDAILAAQNHVPMVRGNPVMQVPEPRYDRSYPTPVEADYPPAINPAEVDEYAPYREWLHQQEARRNTKPLLSSLVVKSVLGGLFGYVTVKYGITVPPEYQDLIVNTILGGSALGAVVGRARATTTVSGLLPRFISRTLGGN